MDLSRRPTTAQFLHQVLSTAVLLLPQTLLAQTNPQTNPSPPPSTLQVTTTLVQVPTLVQTPAKDLVYSLTAPDFRLTDNGVPQHLTLEAAADQPLSLVVLLQTGASAPRLFEAYRHLTTMLEPLLKDPNNRIAVVTFDSHPEAALPFTTDLTPYLDAINHPDPGDDRAAIFDALNFSLDLLAKEPNTRRRAILLLSQPHDLGSRTTLKQIVRRVGETDTAVYSLTFSAAKARFKGALTDPAHLNPPWSVGNGSYVAYFNLGEPLGMILTAMQKNSAAELATLSGGETADFSNRQQFEAALGTLANHLPNRYLLTFQPTSAQPGLHTLHVILPHHPDLQISTRANYWSNLIPAAQ
jgi:VWFA-related protein